MIPTPPKVPLNPWDEYNQRLYASVRPPSWVNPKPAQRYNLVVIGGGTAGLVAAAGAAGLGARVALVERRLLGGDCLNFGCVPSKALIRSARAAASVHSARDFGISVPDGASVDFAAVMARMRRLRADISPNDSAERFRRLGVDVFLGEARFGGPDRVLVGDCTLRFAKAVIATGGRPICPPIPGLNQVPYLTNESLFSLTELPRRLGVVGAGPVGCEMAQAFARFGSEIHLIHTHHGILPREDRDGARLIEASLRRDGVKTLPWGDHLGFRRDSNRTFVENRAPGEGGSVEVDQLLVATGRAPNVEDLGLDAAGVEWDLMGVRVNDRLQTSNPRVYACGDICSRYKFTHAADFMARLVIQNALFRGRAKASGLIIPWCTYTSPEIARVGCNQTEAEERGIRVDTFTQDFREVDRAILDEETAGFVRVHVRRGSDKIVGATIVATHAGDWISELTLAMRGGVGLKTIGSTLHPYPTQADAIRKVGDLYNRTRLTPFVKVALRKWMSWQR